MFHLKDFRRRNVSSSPYLSSRALDSSAAAPNYDPIDEHGFPAHDFPIPNHNTATSEVDDVLAPGDIIGKGSLLRGDIVSLLPTHNDEDQDEQFQVIKELGKGSYAVVYLVHQVFFTRASAPISTSSRARSNTADSSEDGHILGHMDSEEPLTKPPKKTYGRKFAIKCLSKANLDKEELDIQMTEVTIHQSLPLHPNIVALHKTLQTSSYLLLVLEYVPGEDLFYFLQQSRDHCPSPTSFSFATPDPPEDLSQQTLLMQQQTPPTPSLLSSSHPSQLLSRTRLRLIASMFAQMCDAVAACHAVGVFHRDIKPENFIVTDGRYLDEGVDKINGGKSKGRVVVKLTDFGLSTREEECSDMDCGSAPYMSYECRNNIAPTYRPREADVWSLGIVLINMLYHINPWTDTAHGACPSFTAFQRDSVGFFTRLFMGMTPAVAEMLAWRVFGVDTEQTRVNGVVKEKRMTAAELGVWVRSSLVDQLAMDENSSSGVGGGGSLGSGVNGGTSTARMVVNGGHRLSLQMRLSHLPVSRAASPFGRLLGPVGAVPSPRLLGMTLSRAPSLAPALEKEEGEIEVGGAVAARVQEETGVEEGQEQELEQQEEETEGGATPSPPSRTSTTTRKRKRGVRKKKGPATPAIMSQQPDHQEQQDETLKTLADASQSLAREISNVSKAPSIRQLQLLQQQQPSSSSLLTPVSGPNHLNGDTRQTSSSTLSSICTASGISEGGTVLTTPPLPTMSMGTRMAGTTATNMTKPPSANSSNSTRTVSNGSSLRIATGAGGGRSKVRPSRRFEPVSMYPVPSALLSKPIGGTRPPSIGTAHSVAHPGTQSQPQQQEQQEPKAVVKKSSKWMLFGRNNTSGGGNNAVYTSPTTPSASSPIATVPPALVTTSSAPDSGSGQGQAWRSRLFPLVAPGHTVIFSRPDSATAETPARTQPTHPQSVMSPTATNVTDLIMGLNPVSAQPLNGSSGSLVGGSSTPRTRGRRGKGDSMAILSGAAVEAGRSSPYKPKSPSRSPGRGAPSLASGFGSSASSSSVSLVSGAGSAVDFGAQGQARSQQDGWDGYWRDKRSPNSTGLETKGVGYKVGPGGSASKGVVRRPPGGATGFGAGGGRHGSVGAAGGPFASSASSVIGMRRWKASTIGTSTSMGAMSMAVMNASAAASGRSSLRGSASGTASPGGSTSAFSRYSNSSETTMATTVTSGSGTANWRTGRGGAAVAMTSTVVGDVDGAGAGSSGVGSTTNPYVSVYPPKILDGNPWAMNELPRGQQSNTDFGTPGRKTRTRTKKGNNTNINNIINGATSGAPTDTTPTIATDADSNGKDLNSNGLTSRLDTIRERPHTSDLSIDAATTPAIGDGGPSTRKEASTSTTDLVAAANAATSSAAVAIGSVSDEGTGGRVKKVHKGQINTLAKMLSVLRR